MALGISALLMRSLVVGFQDTCAIREQRQIAERLVSWWESQRHEANRDHRPLVFEAPIEAALSGETCRWVSVRYEGYPRHRVAFGPYGEAQSNGTFWVSIPRGVPLRVVHNQHGVIEIRR